MTPFARAATGDTIHLDEAAPAYRLYGITAPAGGKDAERAKKHLAGLLARYGAQGFSVSPAEGTDDLMVRTRAGEDLSYRMVRDGFAFPKAGEPRHPSLDRAAAEARRAKRGLWHEDVPVAAAVGPALGAAVTKAAGAGAAFARYVVRTSDELTN